MDKSMADRMVDDVNAWFKADAAERKYTAPEVMKGDETEFGVTLKAKDQTCSVIFPTEADWDRRVEHAGMTLRNMTKAWG